MQRRELFVPKAVHGVVVDDSNGLHVGIGDSGAHKTKPTPLKIPAL